MRRELAHAPPSLVPFLTSMYPCAGRFYQVEPGDTEQSVCIEVLEASAPGASNVATIARYAAILRADVRWNCRLYGDDLRRAWAAENGDAYASACSGRWPAPEGGAFGLIWCPEITAWEAETGLPLIARAEPPAGVIDLLRVPA